LACAPFCGCEPGQKLTPLAISQFGRGKPGVVHLRCSLIGSEHFRLPQAAVKLALEPVGIAAFHREAESALVNGR